MTQTHLSPEQNERLRQAMRRFVPHPYKTQAALAEAIGIRPPTLSDFLNEKGGVKYETAELFAQRVAKKPLVDIIGARQLPQKPEAGFQVDPMTRRKAIVLLKQPPQSFTDEAIAIAEELTVFRSREAASNPSAVAEAWRLAILGSLVNHPRPGESGQPPPGTRRSKRRAHGSS